MGTYSCNNTIRNWYINSNKMDWPSAIEKDVQCLPSSKAPIGGNEATKKTQKALLKQQYETFRSQLVHEDLEEKTHDDDLEENGFKWNMAPIKHEGRNCSNAHKIGAEDAEHLGERQLRIESVKQENEGFEFKIAKFDKSAKDLSEMLESQITDKSKKGVGYHAVPSPHPLILNRPTPLDLSYSGLEEFKEPEVNEYGPRDSSLKPTIDCDKESDNSKENTDDSLGQHQITDTKTSSVKSSLKNLEVRENNHAPFIKDWMSDDEDDDELNPKVEKKTVIPTATKKEFVKSVKSAHKHLAPRAVLMKTSLKSVNTARPVNIGRSVNTGRPFSTARSFNAVRPSYTAHLESTNHCARPRTYFQNQAQSSVHRPFYKRTAITNSNSQLNDKGFVDSRCSRNMTGNITHLSDFKDFDGGYVTFGGGAYGGRITSKGTIKTDNLDFDDLPDENQILLKIPRQDNMYSFDMKNIVPKDSLTCLVAKATSEESMLWHRRLGHINFKNINKLVKENLGPKAPGSLTQKWKKPKSKKTPSETMVTPPKPTEGSEQSHSVSSGTVPDPQDLKRNIQLAGTRLPSTLNGGTRKSQLLLEGPCRDKDSEGLKPPADMEPQNNPVTDLSWTGAKYQVDETESTRLSDDEEVFEAEEDMEEDTQAEEEQHQSPPPNTDKSKPYPDQETQESESDTSSPELKKYDNMLPLTERQMVKYLRKVSRVLFNRIVKDQWTHHAEVVVSYANLKASIEGYYEENIDHKEQSDKDVVKEDHVLTKKILKATEAYIKNFTHLTELLTLIKNFDFQGLKASKCWGENVTHADTKEPPSHIKGEHVTMEDDAEKPEPPLTDPTLEIPIPQREGKGIATDEQLESTKKLVPASKVV
ncbi:putative ribonuclease H-like domain-containing protein [Tanacetum coccineum]